VKILIIEDTRTTREILKLLLAPYGETHIATNGKEAIEAFKLARQEKQPYDLLCLDIMMPEMDGHEVLRKIRKMEEEEGIYGVSGVKVIITTGMDDPKNMMKAFNNQCEAYLVKPIDEQRLLEELQALGLIKKQAYESVDS
jgi:two-component system chemotaxis response regulator CheY